MKKLFIGAIAAMVGFVVCAANFVPDTTGPAGQGDLQYKDSSGNILFQLGLTNLLGSAAAPFTVSLAGGGTNAGSLTVNDSLIVQTNATVSGKFVIVGGNATTALMLLSGTATNGQTVAFEAAFGAAPNVFLQWTDDIAAGVTNGFLRPSTVTASNFVVDAQFAVTGGPMTNLIFHAHGQRP